MPSVKILRGKKYCWQITAHISFIFQWISVKLSVNDDYVWLINQSLKKRTWNNSICAKMVDLPPAHIPAVNLILWQLGVSNLGVTYVKITVRSLRFQRYLISSCMMNIRPCSFKNVKCQIYRGDPVYIKISKT